MPETEENVSPTTEGADYGKPEGGSIQAEDGFDSSSESERPSYEDLVAERNALKRDYAAAQQESLKNYQWAVSLQNQQSAQAHQPPPQQQSYPSQPSFQVPQDDLSDDEFDRLNTAILDNDKRTIREFFTRYGQKTAQAAINQVVQLYTLSEQQKAQHAARINPTTQYFQQNKIDWNSSIGKRTLELHNQMMAKQMRGEDYTYVDNSSVLQSPGGPINPHLMKLAHEQAKMQFAQRDDAQEVVNARGDNFMEPSGRTTRAPGRRETRVENLLTGEEKRIAERYGMSQSEYFDSFPAEMKAARKRAGKPLRSMDVGNYV